MTTGFDFLKTSAIMPSMFELKAEKRDPKIKSKSLRKSGRIPAVFYGGKTESTPISISKVDFDKIWKKAGESTVITIKTEGVGDVDTLIHEVQFDPVTSEPTHSDFYVVDKTKKVKVHVPIEFVGVSPAIKELGGTLIKVLHELEVESLPGDLPHVLEIDISLLLELNSHLAVKDIKLPKGVMAVTGGHETVVSIAAPREEKEEEAAPIDLSTIEVEKRGKKEEEGAEAPLETADVKEKKEKGGK